MALPAVTGIVATPTGRWVHPRFQSMTVPVTQRVIDTMRTVAPKVAISTEAQIQMTETAGRLILDCRFTVDRLVVKTVILGSYGAGIGMAVFAGNGCRTLRHMTLVANRLQGFVGESLQLAEHFQICQFSPTERMTRHADITTVFHNLLMCIMGKKDIGPLAALLPPFRFIPLFDNLGGNRKQGKKHQKEGESQPDLHSTPACGSLKKS